MDKYCEHCYLCDAKPCMECSTCNPGHRNFKPAPTPLPTNADRIRSMSDEELAKFIGAVATRDWEFRSLYGGYSAALDWLRQPAETEENL